MEKEEVGENHHLVSETNLMCSINLILKKKSPNSVIDVFQIGNLSFSSFLSG